MPELNFLIEEGKIGERIDVYLTEQTGFSRSFIQKVIKDKKVLLNDYPLKANYKVNKGDIIKIFYEETIPLNLKAENIPLDIIYEDNDLLVINKPSGLVSHPGPGHYEHTLVNALMYYSNSLSSVNGTFRPGIVHRLDKDTSGLMVVAKNDETHIALAEQLQDKRCYRKYYALVSGIVPYDSGEVRAAIARDKKDRQKMAVSSEGKEALTLFEVIRRYAHMTLLSLELKTGRTHQIRVHMSYIGYPVENDPKYNKGKADDFGQILHAYYLSFIHPKKGNRMEFQTEIPAYFNEYLIKKGEINGKSI